VTQKTFVFGRTCITPNETQIIGYKCLLEGLHEFVGCLVAWLVVVGTMYIIKELTICRN
jgi:hypothetical protein